MFLVEAGTPGLSLGQPLRKMGWHASDTREVVLDDCLVPPRPCSASRPGLPPDHGGLPAGAAHAGRDGRRARGGVPAAGDRLRARPRGVRLAADQPADDQAPARRPGHRARGGPRAHLPGRGPPGQRPPRGGRSVAMAKYHAATRVAATASSTRASSSSAGPASWRRRRSPGTTATPGSCASAAAPTRSSSRSWPRTCPRDGAGHRSPRCGTGRRSVPGPRIAAARQGGDAEPLAGQAAVADRLPPCSTRAAARRTGCSPTPRGGLPADGVGPASAGSRAGRWPSSRTTSRSRRAPGAS